MMRTVLILSGGLDSTVLLYDLRDQGHEVLALSVDYGQRHRRELAAAARVCDALSVEHVIAPLAGLRPLFGASSQTDPDVAVPDGHYSDDSMRATVVPNRNMLMLAVAAAWAISRRAGAVAYAAHAGDHAQYPDCRAEFIMAMRVAFGLCDWSPLELLAPFRRWTKAEIVSRGAELRVPFGATWSCYKGGAVHCSTCGTCVERREAFEVAGVYDPTPYALDEAEWAAFKARTPGLAPTTGPVRQDGCRS